MAGDIRENVPGVQGRQECRKSAQGHPAHQHAGTGPQRRRRCTAPRGIPPSDLRQISISLQFQITARGTIWLGDVSLFSAAHEPGPLLQPTRHQTLPITTPSLLPRPSWASLTPGWRLTADVAGGTGLTLGPGLAVGALPLRPVRLLVLGVAVADGHLDGGLGVGTHLACGCVEVLGSVRCQCLWVLSMLLVSRFLRAV